MLFRSPLTLREVAAEVGLHESTVSRAVARKYVRTPRGTLSLRAFFASGIDTGGGGETSSTAVQSMADLVADPVQLAQLSGRAGLPTSFEALYEVRTAGNVVFGRTLVVARPLQHHRR